MTEEKEEILEEVKEEGCCCNHEHQDDVPHCCGGGCHHEQEPNNKEVELTNEVNRLTEENKNLVEKVKLAQAELINYRKRKDEETANLLKYANQDLILEIIQVVDNFERAIKLDDNNLTEDISKFLAGFKMMYASLKETLTRFGVEEINRVGQIFDPSQEQALLTDCVEDKEDEVVLEVLLKGYKLKDRVIRPASVKINQK
ncbi:MAG: nucleotide exchange factor GrpE [Bacilli bacterium]|nr:nucleotide exchange factor GrpE [Bacilli bacterium]